MKPFNELKVIERVWGMLLGLEFKPRERLSVETAFRNLGESACTWEGAIALAGFTRWQSGFKLEHLDRL